MLPTSFSTKFVYLGKSTMYLPINQSQNLVPPTTKTLGQYSIVQRKVAKAMYCPKRPVPDKKNVVLSKKPPKTNLMEPVSLAVDQKPQRLGQHSTFAGFLANMLSCPKIFVVGNQKLWDSTALLLKNHLESMRSIITVIFPHIV